MASPSGSADPQPTPGKAEKDALPKKIGKYEIQKKIGAGGMGAVYLALDPFLKRSCALKVLPQAKAKNPTLVKRFRSEAQQAANLRHENIVTVFEAGEADGVSYIALEYVEGTDIAKLVQKRGIIPIRRSIEMIRQVTEALAHAYEQGIVHRDIKPGNLLVRQDGVVKLADLGLARSLDDVDTSITRAGTTVGTVDYMSPEQARDSKAADIRSDLYSLGCTWYFMLTGHPPFPEGSLSQKLRAHADSPVPDPRPENPAITEGILSVIRRMTEKKPALRYQTPQELLADLDSSSLLSDDISSRILEDAPPPEPPPVPSRSKSRADQADDSSSTGKGNAIRRKAAKSKTRSRDDDSDAAPDSDTVPVRGKSKASSRSSSSDADTPAYKPPPRRDQAEKEKLLQPDQPAKGNAGLFYGLVGLLACGLIWFVIWVVGEFNSSSNVSDRTANPFANRDAVGKVGGQATAPGVQVGGNAAVTPANVQDVQGQPGGTNVAGQSPAANAATSTVIPPPPGYSPGRLTTQIGAEPAAPGSEAGGDTDAAAGTPASTSAGGTNVVGAGPGSKTVGEVGGSPATASGTGTGTGKTTSVGGGGGSSSKAGTSSGGQAGTTPRPAAVPKPTAVQTKARNARETQMIPFWAQQPRATEGLPVLTVQIGSSGGNQTFPTLNQALGNVPDGGACIKLVGSGPFPLSPVNLSNKTRVVIEPAGGPQSTDQPVIVLLPGQSTGPVEILNCSQTLLDLRRVHLAWDGAAAAGKPEVALLSIADADVFLQNCSISVKGVSRVPVTAVRVSGKVSRSDPKAGPQPRVLLEETLIRGNQLTAVTIQGEHLDLTAHNSLLWSGTAPALRFGNVARSDADSSRTVRLVSTTVCALENAIEVGGDAGQPVPTNFELLNALVAAPAGSDAPALLRLEGWNASQQKTACGKFLNWKSAATLYTGWSSLLQLNPGAVVIANGASPWQALWKDKDSADKEQFQAARWPAQSIPDIGNASLETLIPQSIGRQYVKTEEGGWPGCAPERLVTVNLEALAAAQVASVRPLIPAGMFALPLRDVLTVDVTKQDLGKVLAGKTLQSGMTIKVTGNGIRQSSPILIENVWVRMLFEQTEGPPLVLTPKAAESKLEGFLNIRNGGVELERAVFLPPTGERAALPRWLVHVEDGDLGLYRCRLQGPLNTPGRSKGLIRWEAKSGKPPARPFEAHYSGYVVIQSSYLAGSGTLIDADIRQRAMIFHNSVLVSRDDLCALRINGPDTEIDGAVDVRFSTLSAADHFWQVSGGDLSVPASTPLSIYADRTVFAPPLRTGAQKPRPIFLTQTASVVEQNQLQWWENRCGYAPDITSFLRLDTDNSREAPQNFDEKWIGQWGREQVLDALRGANGVILKKELPVKADERNKLEPDDFELLPSSRAATWEGGKLPIGAYISTMQIPPARATPTSPAEKTRPAAKTGAGVPSTQSGF